MPDVAHVHRLAADSQVRTACKYLWRYLHRHALVPGDRLPTQAELRRSTEFSNDTLSAAMRLFIDQGLLVRKTGVGTVLAKTPMAMPGLWTVGLAVQRHILMVPFYAQLFSRVQEELMAAGCRCQVHLEIQKAQNGENQFGDFHLLTTDLDDQHIDAVLTLATLNRETWARYRGADIALAHVGSWEAAPCGAVIDQRPMVREAVCRLHEGGCRRIALASMHHPNPGLKRFHQGLQEGFAEVGLAFGSANEMAVGEGLDGGKLLAERLLAMPTEARPDGLVIVDDRIAMGATAVLREQNDYRPQIAVQVNRQAPLAFALPVLQFEVDVERLVHSAVAILLARLNDPTRPERVDWQVPRLVDESPRTFPTAP